MEIFCLVAGDAPLVAAAIHNGHAARREVVELLALSEDERLREEDPYTDFLVEIAPTRLVGQRSRFEVDLNRPHDKAVYLTPDDAWGLNVWKQQLLPELIHRSLANYDLFYETAETVLRRLVALHGRVVVLDIHTYNHRRDGPSGPTAPVEGNPEVNVGTGTMDRSRWAAVVDGFISAMRACEVAGHRLDVRENVRFYGGNFCRWIHETFPTSVCAIAVEFKKTFMDEWTGEVDRRHLAQLKAALESTAPVLLRTLKDMQNEASS